MFIGLGNPGKEYEGTRHNIGFAIVDSLEQLLERSSGWKAGKGEYYYAKGKLAGEDVLLAKPITYMNLSGRAVRDILAFFKEGISDLVVICDDIAIPLGQLRLRSGGSDGGHNGLSSIIYELGTDEFARLRFGVGADFYPGEQAKYVLSKFKASESKLVDEMIIAAKNGCLEIVRSGISRAMNTINMKPKPLS
ncbi:MAG: aminoacyl-tRNA hydrolase [Bacteroidota bacterium]|nr:aminoacyl-tRNA hydrolase [Bacteroidota bacterium]MDP4235467.1 aminoacyl-tRNA hydrolase [Bacteroidota bacterium]